MYPINLEGKKGIIFGVANQRSIAWAIAQTLHQAGAELAFTYQGPRLKEGVARLVQPWGDAPLMECDVTQDGHISRVFEELRERFGSLSFVVHSVAFADREEMAGNFYDTSRQGFHTAMEVSAYSLIPIAKHASDLMASGGSIITLTFTMQLVYPGYNIMGTAKAALEQEVRHLAAELGPRGVRVNALSSGPLDTLAARGLHRFVDLKHIHAERAPLKRNITHEEVAAAALFLLSDMASGITGAILPVDGGYHIMGV